MILHDRLIPREALAHARPDAQLVYVGKEGAGAQVPQEDTHAFLLEHAPPWLHVVLASRSEPPLPLSRLGSHGAVLRLVDDDLRFSPEELTGFAERGACPQIPAPQMRVGTRRDFA